MENTQQTTSKPAQTKTEVLISVEADKDASRITAVLEALGYAVLRQLDEGDAPARLAWAIDRLVRRHGLTPRERDVLEGVLAGRDNSALARQLGISRATVKWHLHNVFAKVGVGTREALLRLSLQLGAHADTTRSDLAAGDEHGDDSRHRAGPEDITRRIE
ncbi:helix-turn-helix transcriptional regulator [Pseudenhygromyxa sp. WMMC2535]|uniref:helix-turn-helix domain-containing protein n=1 Tax=Pseudenhygromyxa sp. WMMC2535 TaxID=2712867 RepID=UPI001552EAFD|nr:helix-turn-helix transcriptional regulator [Pseudenhygromyxa sp. WMMC2535]NVB42265.1 helix-turn-helix transcriptional regulator [Pseudenhygromyxa sp. WMMC2535]